MRGRYCQMRSICGQFSFFAVAIRPVYKSSAAAPGSPRSVVVVAINASPGAACTLKRPTLKWRTVAAVRQHCTGAGSAPNTGSPVSSQGESLSPAFRGVAKRTRAVWIRGQLLGHPRGNELNGGTGAVDHGGTFSTIKSHFRQCRNVSVLWRRLQQPYLGELLKVYIRINHMRLSNDKIQT